MLYKFYKIHIIISPFGKTKISKYYVGFKVTNIIPWDFTCIKNISILKCDKKGCQMYRSIIKDNRI